MGIDYKAFSFKHKRHLITVVSLLLLSECTQREGVVTPSEHLALPACRTITIGKCDFLWCAVNYAGGLDRVDPACIPEDATVRSK